VAFKDANVKWTEILHQFPVEARLEAICKIFSLDAGELAALVFMSQDPGLLFVTDDAAARLVATKPGYNVRGTIGVLLRAIRRDLMKPEEVIDRIKLIPFQSSLYIKASLLQEVISQVEQEFDL
jgi:predicted nucleic acid-binding protein